MGIGAKLAASQDGYQQAPNPVLTSVDAGVSASGGSAHGSSSNGVHGPSASPIGTASPQGYRPDNTTVHRESQDGQGNWYPQVVSGPVQYPNVQYPAVQYPQPTYAAEQRSENSHSNGQQQQCWGQALPYGNNYGVQQPFLPAHPYQQTTSFHQRIYLDINMVSHKLNMLVVQNKLQTFYSPQAVGNLARQVAHKNLPGMARDWKLSTQMMYDLVGLSLYDTVIMCDDSTSMRTENGGDRIEDLKVILNRVSTVCGLLDLDGISILTMNSDLRRDNIRNSLEAGNFVKEINFAGGTPLGTMLEKKVLQPLVYNSVRSGTFRKPVHVIIITDGEPTTEPVKQVRTVIAKVKDFLKSSRYGGGAVAFQFAQVGTDELAQKFLSKLDTDSKVGRMVDCTSAFELEQAEAMRQSGVDLTPDMYLTKLCLGAIDRSYDEKDELKKKSAFKRLFS